MASLLHPRPTKEKDMKMFVMFALLAGMSAQADSYVCRNLARQGLAAGVYTLKIKEIGKFQLAKDYDTVGRAEILITSQSPRASQPTAVRKGIINIYQEDVVYRAVSKDLGISFRMYLDQLEETYLDIYSQGKKVELRMACKLTRPLNN
jgi:hypothetical protein